MTKKSSAADLERPSWYHRQEPFRTLYIVYFATTLLIALPFITVKSFVLPIRPGWSLNKQLNVWIMRNAGVLMGRVGLQLGRDLGKDPPEAKLKQSRLTHAPPIPEDKISGFLKQCMIQAGVVSARVPLFWFMRPAQLTSFSPKAKAGEKVLLLAGGGAFCAGNAIEGELTSVACEALVQASKDMRIVSLDYRNAHNGGNFPGAVLDALSAYAYLLDLGYEAKNICVGGASAGGIIIHQLVRYLIESEMYPVPRGVLFSSVTWDWTDNAAVTEQNLPLDWVPPSLLIHARAIVLAGLPSDTVNTLYWSPIASKDLKTIFKGFPPTFLQIGGAEILLAQNLIAKEAFEASGVPLTFNLEEQAVHDPLIGKSWQAPERQRIAAAIVKWNDSL